MYIELSKHALVIHNIMLQAFIGYDQVRLPSSALKETIDSIQEGLDNGERAFKGFPNVACRTKQGVPFLCMREIVDLFPEKCLILTNESIPSRFIIVCVPGTH